jgi:serine/threonine protein phosphatase 1
MADQKTFIIGDVHGCLGMLMKLMEKIAWRAETDRLIFLGDYIDRGKDSRGVIDFILSISERSPHVECLMGNHENILLDFLSGRDPATFFLNGGRATLNSYRIHNHALGDLLIPKEHVDFLKSLRTWIELDEYYVVHAGFKPEVSIAKQSLDDLLWIRESFIFSDYNFGKKVIFGHTPFAHPVTMPNKIGLDTGAVYGNKLTCLELPAFRFHFVEAKEVA